MDYKYFLTVTAGVIMLLSYIPYIHSIFKKRTKPMKSTWISLALLDTLMITSLYAKDAVNGLIAGNLIGMWILAFVSCFLGVPGWKRIDIATIIFAILSAIVWFIQGDAIFGIIGSTIAYFFSYIPTILSALEDPSREDLTAWVMCLIACVLAVIAIPVWTFTQAVQPVSFLLTEGLMVYLIFAHPIIRGSSRSRT